MSRRVVIGIAAGVAVGAVVLGATPAMAAPTAPTQPQPRRIVSGWLPYWLPTTSAQAVVKAADVFGDASPFWYTVTRDPSTGASVITSQIDQMGSRVRAQTLTTLRTTGVRLLPTVTDSMGSRRMAAVLTDPQSRARHVSQLVSLAVTNGYAGIDLDYETFAFTDGTASWATTRPAWVAFIAALSKGLHARGLSLSVTTPPIYDAGRTAASGYWVYDWASISPYVDRLRIMAYDYAWSRPGPIGGPLTWARTILRTATAAVAPAKVQLGIAQYGRNWVRRNANGSLMVTGTCPVSNPADLSRKTWDSSVIPGNLRALGVPASAIRRDAASGELTARYTRTYAGTGRDGKPTKCSVGREVWWPDSGAAVARAKLVPEFRIRGVALWAVGGEDPATLGALRKYAQSIAVVPTTVTVSAPARATFRSQIIVRATTASAAGPAVDTPATLEFRAADDVDWTQVGASRTDAAGVVEFTTVASRSGSWRVRVAGDWSRLPDTSGIATTRVRMVVTARAAKVAQFGRSTPLRVTATLPVVHGRPVTLQRLAAGRWAVVTGYHRVARTDAAGRVTVAWRPSRRGVWTLRLAVGGGPTLTGATSVRFAVRVR